MCNPDEMQRNLDSYLEDYLCEMAKKGDINITNEKILEASINIFKKAWEGYKTHLYSIDIKKFTFITFSAISWYAGTNPSFARLDNSFVKFFDLLSKFPSSHPEIKKLLNEIKNCLDVETVLLSPGIGGVFIKNGKWYGTMVRTVLTGSQQEFLL